MPISNRIGDYIDGNTAVVTNPLDDAFGDSVWRSSWLYASLLVIRGKAPQTYDEILATHGIQASHPSKFLTSFLEHGTGDEGWTVIGSTQKFSGDQFAPLLYLLESVSVFGTAEERNSAGAILDSLLELERKGTPLSDSPSGKIRPNLGYVIDVLCDQDRYDKTYRTTDLPIYLVPCLGDIECARKKRRTVYKEAFSVALTLQAVGADQGLDEFSFFNAIALTTLQALAWGPGDGDVRKWRDNFHRMASQGGGPAFQIAAGTSPAPAVDSFRTATTCRAADNDIVMSQRPSKFRDGTFPNPPCDGGTPRTIVLDYVILKALELAWNG